MSCARSPGSFSLPEAIVDDAHRKDNRHVAGMSLLLAGPPDTYLAQGSTTGFQLPNNGRLRVELARMLSFPIDAIDPFCAVVPNSPSAHSTAMVFDEVRGADGVRSLERGLAILKAMNAYPSLSLSQLATRSGMPRSTVYRLVDTLRSLGYLEASDSRCGYRVTHAVLDLSCGFVDEDWLNVAAAKLIETGETLHWPLSLFTFAEAAMVIRRTTHERSSLSIDYGMTGRHMPMTETAAGQAYLAFCPDAEREWLLSLPTIWSGPKSGVERDVLMASLDRARIDGFGRRTGGLMPKTSSISIPVIAESRIRCCISVIWISSALTMQRAMLELAPPLKRAASEIEAYIMAGPTVSRPADQPSRHVAAKRASA